MSPTLRQRFTLVLVCLPGALLLFAAVFSFQVTAASQPPGDDGSLPGGVSTAYPGLVSESTPTGYSTPSATPPWIVDPKYVTREEVVIQLIAAETAWPQTYDGPQIFTDVPPQFASYAAVNTAYILGVIDGYPCGGEYEPCLTSDSSYFRLKRAMTRGEFAELVVRASDWPLVDTCLAASFTDVPCDDQTYSYVETAYAHGLVSGYQDGTFRPNEPILKTSLHFPEPSAAPSPVDRQTPAVTTPEGVSMLSYNASGFKTTRLERQQASVFAAPASVALPPNNRFGVDTTYFLDDCTTNNPNCTILDGTPVHNEVGMQALGANIVRYRIAWNAVQPNDPNQLSWPMRVDSELHRLASEGLGVLLEVGTDIPEWACISPCHVIDPGRTWRLPYGDYGAFYEFAKQAVLRYTVSPTYSVQMVEITNEPDSYGTWGNNLSEYINVLKGAYNAIHASKPNIPVMMGGLGYDPSFNTSFLSTILAQAGNYTDAINFHHYDWNVANNHWPNTLAVAVKTIVSLPGATGKPLILSESSTNSQNRNCSTPTRTATPGGAATATPGPTLTPTLYGDAISQAGYASRLLARSLSLGISTTIWYRYRDYSPDDCPFGSNGLVDLSRNTKPSFDTFLMMTWQLQYPGSYVAPLNYPANLRGTYGNSEGYSFNRQVPNDPNHGIAWAWENAPGAGVTFRDDSTFYGFAKQDGSYGCYVPNGDCAKATSDPHLWVWPRDPTTYPQDKIDWDKGIGIAAFFANVYYPPTPTP